MDFMNRSFQQLDGITIVLMPFHNPYNIIPEQRIVLHPLYKSTGCLFVIAQLALIPTFSRNNEVHWVGREGCI